MEDARKERTGTRKRNLEIRGRNDDVEQKMKDEKERRRWMQKRKWLTGAKCREEERR